MRDQITTVQSTVGTLRRRRGVLLAAAFMGLAAGIAFVFVQPPPLTSTTLVLLPSPAVADTSSSDVATQIRIALSASILKEAGQAVTPALPARRVEKMVKASAPTDQIIQIDATSTDAAQAQTLSQAVADSYVKYVSDTAREVTAAAMADLTLRRDKLQSQTTQLEKEITATTKRQRDADPNSAEGREEAQLLAGLRTQQANLSLQLDRVEDKIATGTPAGASAGNGTSVVQNATEATGLSDLVRLLVWAPVGALVGAILAAGVVLLLARRDPRVRLRDEIADAVGSPVLAAVQSKPQRSVAGWSTLLESYQATAVESWAFRRLLRDLASGDRRSASRATANVDFPQSLTVVSLSGDGRGVAIGPQLAAFASSLGITTRVVTGARHGTAAALFAACATERKVAARPALYVSDVPDAEPMDLTIILAVVDRREPKLTDTPASAATILSVASGTATEEELARVAVAVDDTGRRIDGIVVADPDQSDTTSGRHTLDERSRRPALPVKLTGMASSAGRDQPRNRA